MPGLFCIAGQRMGRRPCGVRIVTGCRPACGVAWRRAMPDWGPRACSKTGCSPKKRGIFGLFMCILVLFLMRPGARMRRFRYLCKIKFE